MTQYSTISSFFPCQLTRPSASLIARRAGATQYAEHLESSSEERKRHGISKRLVAGEDGDYDAYQGVLGRAGIDFPVLPGIPKTSFNCKSVGNGYFADLDTECQVMSSQGKNRDRP